jgi:hypothetical protein
MAGRRWGRVTRRRWRTMASRWGPREQNRACWHSARRCRRARSARRSRKACQTDASSLRPRLPPKRPRWPSRPLRSAACGSTGQCTLSRWTPRRTPAALPGHVHYHSQLATPVSTWWPGLGVGGLAKVLNSYVRPGQDPSITNVSTAMGKCGCHQETPRVDIWITSIHNMYVWLHHGPTRRTAERKAGDELATHGQRSRQDAGSRTTARIGADRAGD